MTVLYPNLFYNEVCYKGTKLYMDWGDNEFILLFYLDRVSKAALSQIATAVAPGSGFLKTSALT